MGRRRCRPATRSEIEEVANLAVRKDLPVSATFMPLPQAREIGALALFGETYGEDVRVVEIGGPWSRELCGGTHVQHSSQIGALTVTGESSVGSGVRRVEAFVGIDALRYLARERAIVAELSGLVGARPDELAERVGAMVTRLKDAERELERARREQVQAAAGNLTEQAARRQRRDLPRPRRRARPVPTTSARWSSTCADGSAPTARASSRSPARPRAGRSSSSRRTRPARERGIRAGDLVRVAAGALGGGGGGKDDIAQGGGQDASKVRDALAAVEWRVGELAG